MAQIFIYAMFAHQACHNSNPAKARRWKASFLLGGLGSALGFVFLWAVINTFAVGEIVHNESLHRSGIVFSTVIYSLLWSFMGAFCISAPTALLNTIGIYISFLQTGDYWLDKLWKKPGLVDHASSSVRYH